MDGTDSSAAALSARHLGQLLLMQSVLESLPDESSVFSFVCRGLAKLPGVAAATFRDVDAGPAEDGTFRFPLTVGGVCLGSLLLRCDDPAAFEPYRNYVRNFCFMLAVILEERRHRHALEQQVQERTRQLEAQVVERDRAKAQVQTLLAESDRARRALIDTLEDQARTEAALRRSEGRYRTLFEHAPDGILVADAELCVVEANASACRMLGYDRNDLIGLHAADILIATDAQAIRSALDVSPTGAKPRREWQLRRKDGSVLFGEVSTTAMAEGHVQTIIRDVTERKQAEVERMRLATVMEQVADAIIVTDRAGTIQYVNPAFETTTGYSRQEALGRNPRVLKSGAHDAEFYGHLWATLLRGEVWHGRFINRRKDGQLFEAQASISPIFDTSGQISNYVAVTRDVTREVQLESQLRHSQKMEAIGQLAGGVAHDFNNILTIILGCTDQADTPELPQDVREALAIVRDAAERAANLTRQLLLFSRRHVLQPRELDVNDVVSNLVKMLQRIIGEDVRLRLDLHPAPLTARADAGMLEQVLMNLAVNARDAMPGGGDLIITTMEHTLVGNDEGTDAEAVPGRYVGFAVRDTGHGIPPEVLPRIFEPFFTTKATGKGSGLGLATVYGIVKQHAGWLTVDSEPGRGTEFRVFLPAFERSTRPAEPRQAASAAQGGTEGILLVEDEGSVRLVTRTILERHGYRVFEGADGTSALDVWQAHRHEISLLLTDLVMPGGVSGLDLARRLECDAPQLKVVFTSGYIADLAGRELALKIGENFLQKPFQSKELLDTVRKALDG